MHLRRSSSCCLALGLLLAILVTTACGNLEVERQGVSEEGDTTPFTGREMTPDPLSTPIVQFVPSPTPDDDDMYRDDPVEIPQDLLDTANREGAVSVIVTLDIPYLPEAELPDDQAVAEQRARITAAQNDLLDALREYNAEETNRFEVLPQIVLTVDSEALHRLTNLPHVQSVAENVLDQPGT